MNYILKITYLQSCRDQLGLYRVSPSKPLRTRLIHIGPNYWTICRSFEIILE